MRPRLDSRTASWLRSAAQWGVGLLILWLLGFSLQVGGSLIHALLVIALIVLIFNFISGRRGV